MITSWLELFPTTLQLQANFTSRSRLITIQKLFGAKNIPKYSAHKFPANDKAFYDKCTSQLISSLYSITSLTYSV